MSTAAVVTAVTFSRAWAMPSPDTCSIPPIGAFVREFLERSTVSVDLFAKNRLWATHTNDLDPDTAAQTHMDAEDYIDSLVLDGVKADLVICDPPYSPTQMRRVYKNYGLERDGGGTRNAELYKRVRDKIPLILSVGGTVLSFGWNSSGMGIGRGFELTALLLVCHGAAHNDTICIAEILKEKEPQLL